MGNSIIEIKKIGEEISDKSLYDLPQAAEKFLKETSHRKIIAFYGSMGAGKTTFIKALCEELGVEDVVNSPTFTIVNEYGRADGEPLYHFDFYRIESLKEAIDIGLEEYFESGYLCLLEWPEKIEELLPDNTLKVFIQEAEEGNREIRYEL